MKQRRLCTGLALAESVSRAGDAVGDVLGVFVSKEEISRAFGQTNLKSVWLATGLGAASSSCSYAAVAAARSAIQQGAALVPALAFMFASTNLVIELGTVLWVLMGWQFVLAGTSRFIYGGGHRR